MYISIEDGLWCGFNIQGNSSMKIKGSIDPNHAHNFIRLFVPCEIDYSHAINIVYWDYKSYQHFVISKVQSKSLASGWLPFKTNCVVITAVMPSLSLNIIEYWLSSSAAKSFRCKKENFIRFYNVCSVEHLEWFNAIHWVPGKFKMLAV